MNCIDKKSAEIAIFWDFFLKNHHRIINASGMFQKNLWNTLGKKLKDINRNLRFEFELLDNGTKHFIISADGIEEVFEYVELVFQNRPVVDGWKISKFRQPLSTLENMSITINDETEIALSKVKYYIDLESEHGLGIIVLLFIPGYSEAKCNREMLKWLILDSVLGEYDAVKKVSYCEIGSLGESGNIPIKDLVFLRDDVNKMCVSLKN